MVPNFVQFLCGNLLSIIEITSIRLYTFGNLQSNLHKRNLIKEVQRQIYKAEIISDYGRDIFCINNNISVNNKTKIYKTFLIPPIITYALLTKK